MTDTVLITPTRAQFNGGQFDSNFRYVRKTNVGTKTTILRGPGVSLSLNSDFWRISWRFRVGNYAVVGLSEGTPAPAFPSNTPAAIDL